jgi:LPXTG-motif cell wall-anchored protein
MKNKKLLFFIAGFTLCALSFVLNNTTRATSALSPGDIYIVTVNSDASYSPATPNSNGFDFVSKVDLDPGTVIYFTDNGWDNTTSFWRSGGEGLVRYTVPAGGISAGTVVRYDDSLIPSLPSSGSGTWDMYDINNDGTISLSTIASNGFDPATGGDNILVFQGSAASPNFIFGIGWSTATTWISSGSPTSNNSYIPPALSIGGGTIVSLGSTDNYQYKCTATGVFSSSFAVSLQNVANWNSNDTSPYGASVCTFDTSRPIGTIDELLGQNDPTNNPNLSFTITFDSAIDPASFTTSDIILSGTGSAVINSVTSSDNLTWTVSLTASSEGTIIINLANGSVQEISSANLNGTTLITDNSILYDTTVPSQLGAPDLISSTDSGLRNDDDITNNQQPTFSGSCTDGDTIELLIDGAPVIPTVVCSGGQYSITPTSPIAEGVHNVTVTATDPAGNTSSESASLEVTIDITPPSCNANDLNGFELSPEVTGYVDDPDATVVFTIDSNDYTATNNSGTWTIAAGTIGPNLAPGQDYTVVLECTDVAGNSATNSNLSYSVLRHVDLFVSIDMTNDSVVHAGDTVTYTISITNIDSLYPFTELGQLFIYGLFPTTLGTGVAPGSVLSTSNPSQFECVNMGGAETIDQIWEKYAGNNLIVCGLLTNDPLLPGDSLSFNISFTASADLPDNFESKVLIYDDNEIDPDSEIISESAGNGEDFYALNLNSVSKNIYKLPVATETSTSTNASSVTSYLTSALANTGMNTIISIGGGLSLIAASGILLARNRRRR